MSCLPGMPCYGPEIYAFYPKGCCNESLVCPVNSDIVIYSGPNLPSTGINTNDSLTVALQKIDVALSSDAIINTFITGIATNPALQVAFCALVDQCAYIPTTTTTSTSTTSTSTTAFPTVTIGTQIWMGRNLDVSTYRNGDIIPQVTDPTAWEALTTGAWCYYNNDSANDPIYGKLYNWYAINDIRGLAPLGYHVATAAEVTTLKNYLTFAGSSNKLREAGTTHWQSPNTGATNSTGWTGLPGGFRATRGSENFGGINTTGVWANPDTFGASNDTYLLLYNNPNIVISTSQKFDGNSIRCIKD